MSDDDKKPSDNPFFSMSAVKNSMDHIHQTLRSRIHQSVESTNQILATLEMETKKVSRPVVSGLKTVEHQGSHLAQQATRLYERRREYGPHLVAGSAAVVGSLALLRRGKVSAVVSGALAGGVAYMGVYNPVPLQDIPDILMGRGISKRD